MRRGFALRGPGIFQKGRHWLDLRQLRKDLQSLAYLLRLQCHGAPRRTCTGQFSITDGAQRFLCVRGIEIFVEEGILASYPSYSTCGELKSWFRPDLHRD